MLNATIEPLRSATRSPSVKRFVYIGSGSNTGPDCRDDSWREVTAEAAADQANRSSLYRASRSPDAADGSVNTKALAEKAAFDFVETARPTFSLVSLNPTMCLGPRGGQIVDPMTPFFGNVGRFERLLLHRETDFAKVRSEQCGRVLTRSVRLRGAAYRRRCPRRGQGLRSRCDVRSLKRQSLRARAWRADARAGSRRLLLDA